MRDPLWLLVVGWGLLQATDLASPVRAEDNVTGTVTGSTPGQCGEDQFACEDGQRCIPRNWQCDSLPHCADGSDELHCPWKRDRGNCTPGQFRCNNNDCIPDKWVCDGFRDCGTRDMSDEWYTQCLDRRLKNLIRCGPNAAYCSTPLHTTFKCLPLTKFCDITINCPDGSDEWTGCRNDLDQRIKEFTKCGSDAAHCSTPVHTMYTCLPLVKFCDGHRDCPDGSDEWDVCDEGHNETTCADLRCEVGCRPTFDGPACYCHEGYRADGPRCVDIDECETTEMCDHLCTNTQGSYVCSCRDGYVQLEYDQRGCRAVDDPVVVVGTQQGLHVYRAGVSVGVVPALGVTGAYLDRGGDSFCYVHRNVTNASLVCRETAHPERARVLPAPSLFRDLSSTGALALDWVSGNLYLYDEKHEVVYACRPDGVRCLVIVTDRLSKVRGLAVDPLHGFLFWTVWEPHRPALERSLLYGSARTSLMWLKLEAPTALVLDTIRRHVYWLEAKSGELVRTDYDGRRRHIVLDMRHAGEVRGMSLLHPILYLPWSERKVQTVWMSVARLPRPQPRDITVPSRPIFTVVASPLSQPSVPHHPCSTNNGGCEHLCITAYHNETHPNGVCECSHGYRHSGHTTCMRVKLDEFTLVVAGRPPVIKSVPLAGDALHRDWEPLVPVTDVGSPTALAYDGGQQVLYYADAARHEIVRQNLDGTGREVVLAGLQEPAGLAPDLLARNLYWTDAALGTVNVVRLSRTSVRRVLVTEPGSHPRGIVLATLSGLMFWAAWGSGVDSAGARFQLADMAGGAVRTIVSEGLHRPVGLGLYNNRLYWCDPELDNVEWVDLMTLYRKKIVKGASKPTGVFVYGGVVYWAERDTGLLMKRGDNGVTIKLRTEPPPLMALHVVYNGRSKSQHSCTWDNGGCTELCLPTPAGRTCACAADNDTCYEPTPAPYCPDGQFHCGRGRCIDSLYVCDGDLDCPDGSDENATASGICAHMKCLDHQFRCDTTRCIVRSWVCDGLKDCRDETDEGVEACGRATCRAGLFVCAVSKRCIPGSWRCDGAADCGTGDNSDELGCAGAAACPPSMFSCDDGGCAPWEYYCDGRADCRDASDERGCASTPASPASTDLTAPAVCEEHEYQCRNMECIRTEFRCDGRVDCLDGSDEQNCQHELAPTASSTLSPPPENTSETPSTTAVDSCSWPALSCDNATRCVPPLQLCDGSADCGDGTDEADRCGEDMCAEWTCSHGCQPAPAGPVCSCPAGLHLQTDRRTCGPNHPCEEWGVCSQTCQPQKNRHKCTCMEDYRLADDGFTCKSTDDAAPLLVFSNRHELRALELRAGAAGGSRPLVSSLKNSIALDWHRNGPSAPLVLYWSDVLDDAIYRGELAGPGGVLARIEPVLRGGLVAAEGLAVDWVAGNLYWVAGAPRQIEVATLAGLHRTTLLAGGMERPRALALDARRGLLFWTDWEEREPRIERCTLAGGERRVAVAVEPGGWPNGLALDFAPERLYWIDARSDSVHTSLYDGSDRREVLRGHPALSHPFAIALFESHVYWTDWRANGVVRANKWNGSDALVVQRTLSQPFDVKVVHASRRPGAETPCSVRAGGCSHLCLVSRPGERECACPHAMRLAADGSTCTPREVALLVARAGELLGLDPEEPARPLLPAVAGRPLAPVALHFHAASRRIFWADSGLDEVRAVGLTTGPPVTLADAGVHSPRALALDWLAGLLFYSTRRAADGGGDVVLVTDLSGERPAVLLDETAALGQVTGLAAHPRRGKLYWTHRAGGKDLLEESGEDGSARRALVVGTGQASGLALDAAAGLIYWVNTDDGSVRSADPVSGRVRDVALPVGAHVSAVAVHGGVLYWADEAAGSLRSCPPDNCTQPRTLRNDTDEVLALRVYDAAEQSDPGGGGACSLRHTPCTQLCLPVSETDSVCRCALGYTPDGPRCEGAEEAVIFSTGSSVVGVDPESGQEVLARLPRTAGASSLALLVAEDALFWADGERGGIWRVRRDGSGRQAVLLPGLDDVPTGLALDGAGGTIYWGDARARLVEVSRTDGTHRAALLELPAAPSSLVLDEVGGWLFAAAGTCVSRARPDGTDHRLLHNGSTLLGLGAHPATRTLYLLEAGPPAALRSIPYEGGESALLLSDSPLQHPVALAVSGDRLYWLDTQHERGALMTAPLSDASAARPLLTSLGDSLKDVAVWSRQSPPPAPHPCAVNNGGCSQLCLWDAAGSAARCVCPHGRVTPQGGCEPHEQFVVFARVTRLEFLHTTDDGPLDAPYGTIEDKELMRNAIALTYEYNSSLLFYSDIQRGTINMVHFNGTDLSVLVDQQGAVEGLAFESTSRTLYWSSSGPARLMRASLTELLETPLGARAGRVKTVLYLGHGARPRGLDVDPCLSRVYWADWNSTRPAIQRAFSNGYQLETVIRTDILMPNGLALDRAARKLYWADARLDKIERAEYDGSRRRVLTSSLAAHPFDLAVLGGYVYWTDWVGRGVFRADKLTGDAVQLRADVPRPMGVAAAGPEPDSCPPDPCRLLNGGCAELCRTDAAGAVECACRDSRALSSDGHSCADPTMAARCPEDRFPCTEGPCVPLELTCDGVAHCGVAGNSSDEDLYYCTSRPCPRGWFSCGAGGRCAPPSAVCDGRADCDDAADERSCECGPQQARCASGRCVPASWRCDGVSQCADGSDELQCPRTGCAALGPTAKACSSGGGCYLPSWRCDKARDCDDGSDEWNCTFVDADSAASDTSVMETAVSGCGDMQFACGNGTGTPASICIPASWRCDGRADCADGSDETEHCRARTESRGNCSREEYRCDDGACIPRGALCDGVAQCGAGEDERQCECAPDTFRCRDSAECRDRTLYCDGDADCDDGSDEPPGCSPHVSPPPPEETPCAAEPGSVSCAGRCVPRDLRCDGRDHCQDGGGQGAGTDEDPVDCSSYERNVGGGTGATGASCAADQWRCTGGACVSRGTLCDGRDDCGDFSDELHCHIDECKFENGGCSQHCADLPVGRACWCRAGYRLDGDGSSCRDVDECREDRPCDHVCRNTVGSYACSCRAGYSLMQDGFNCAADGDVQAALIFTNRYYIRRAELRPGAPTALLVHNLTNGVALDMDWAGGCLYWSDVTRAGSSIRRACRDEPGRQQVLHAATLQNPDGLAVDWVAGNLYWCDKGTDTIEVSRLDGRHRRVLLRDGLQEPRALALDPLAGLLYWSDWGSRAHIGRAGMDGAGRRVLLARGLGWPNALTLHRPADELYFADAREDYVAVLELGSLRVRTLLSRARQPWLRLHHVFALAVWRDQLYWSDWETRAVEGCRRIPPPASSADCHTVASLLHKPMDLRVFHPARQPLAPELTAACVALQCAGACLLAAGPGGARATCSCPEHFELAPDRRSCSPRCTSAHFECRSTLKCIPYWWRCDTQDDCGDGSDEARSCPRFYCAPGQFQCDTDRCLHPAALCDGTAQCTDGADERDCDHFTCLASQWKCAGNPATNTSARCIPAALRCDGRADCPGGHDEAGCPPRTCPPHHFTCANGRCITPVWVCDADSDCGDGSDEGGAMCAARTCSRAEFRCDSGRCIPRDWLCDGEPDCPGREDERSCDRDVAPCEPTYFRCPGTDRRCIPGRWRCDFEEDCTDGADEHGCTPRACSESEFRCGTGECVRDVLVCSGSAECGDGSDEEGCGATCAPGARACKAGPHCVPQEWWCDGESDCGDGSDEEECEGGGAVMDDLCGGPGGFRCGPGAVCMPPAWRCDGRADCPFGTDERDCENLACPPDEFRCSDGTCITDNLLCDGSRECAAGEDEEARVCAGRPACLSGRLPCGDGRCVPDDLLCDEPGSDECEFGACSQLCLARKRRADGGARLCKCAPGYRMRAGRPGQEGRHACEPMGQEPRLLVGGSDGVRLWEMSKSSRDARGVWPAGARVTSVAGALCDGTWWTWAVRGGAVYRANVTAALLGSGDATVDGEPLLKLEEERALAVCVEGGRDRLYISSAGPRGGALHVATLEGRRRVVLWRRAGSWPSSVALHGPERLLFWSDAGARPAVMVSGTDGSSPRELVTRHLRRPTAVTVDSPARRLYFADVRLHTLETVRLDGGDRRLLADFGRHDSPHSVQQLSRVPTGEVRGAAVVGEWLLVACRRGLLRVHKRSPPANNANNTTAPPLLGQYAEARGARLAAVAVLHEVLSRTDEPDACVGRCSDSALCVPAVTAPGYSCLCPDGLLPDESEPVPERRSCVSGPGVDTGTTAPDSVSCPLRCPPERSCVLTAGAWRCACPALYSGPRCDVPRCPATCACPEPTGPEESPPRCVCAADRDGPHCSRTVPAGHEMPPCSARPCLHGGTCATLQDRSYCTCPPGHSGRRCELCHEPQLCRHNTTDASSANNWSPAGAVRQCGPALSCGHGGRCLQLSEGHGSVCVCEGGWGGALCDEYVGHDHACLSARCPPPAVCVWRGREPYCACPARAACSPRDLCRQHCAEHACFLDGLGRPQCRCGPHCSFDPALETSPRGLPGATLTVGVLAVLALLCGVLAALYVLRGRRRRSFGHRRLADNVEITNPMYQPHDDDDLPPHTQSPAPARAGAAAASTTSHHFANPVYDTMYAGSDDVRAASTDHEHAGLLSEDSPVDGN